MRCAVQSVRKTAASFCVYTRGAFAVLIGKEEAQAAAYQASENHGPSGFVKARCSAHKDQSFVLEWHKAKKSPFDHIDRIVMSNPQTLEWDQEVDGYVRVDASGKRFDYDDTECSKAGGSPFDGYGDHWKSVFEAEVDFETGASCPCCQAPILQWCEHCDTIFCHKRKEDYPSHSYACPSCAASYGWGAGFTGDPIKRVFDGKHLRSLATQERKALRHSRLLKK